MYEGKLRCSLVMALVITSLGNCDQTTQKYLESAVRNLKNLRQLHPNKEIVESVQGTKITRRNHQYTENVPPLSLTKGELASLYEQAVEKGETLKLDTGGSDYVHAVVHHLDDNDKHPEENQSPPNEGPHGEDAGYYYYYYPLKSFMDEITSQPAEDQHVHNITIQTADQEKKETKPMEPLFMAISGFIGMAVLMVISMVMLPKFGVKPKVATDVKKKDKELDDFARFALNAIEGHCAERFACELTKTARSFDIEDNRFYKLLKRVAPGTFGRYINNSGKYVDKQLQCTSIPCKKKLKPNTKNNNHQNQNKRPATSNQKKKNNVNKKY